MNRDAKWELILEDKLFMSQYHKYLQLQLYAMEATLMYAMESVCIGMCV